MRRRIGLGILLILAGIVLTLMLVGGYEWNWSETWPIFLILLGILDLIENGWRGLRGGGGFLLVLGGFLLLFTMHLLPWSLREAWPSGLILLGILNLLDARPNLAWAVTLICGGAFLLAITTDHIHGDWSQFWPVILILVGLAALFGREDHQRNRKRVPAAVIRVAPPPPPDPIVCEPDQADRMVVLARIRAGELTVEQGAAIIEAAEKNPPRDGAPQGGE